MKITGHSIALLLMFSVHAVAQQSVRTAPVIHMPETIRFCPNIDFTIYADSISGGTPPFQYCWQHEQALIGWNDSIQLNLSDTLFISLTVIDSNGKMNRDSILAIPYEPIDAGFETNYWEGCVPLKVTFHSNNAAYQYMESMEWLLGNGDSRSQFASVVYEYTTPGIYEPSLSITDLHGCVWTDTLAVPVRVYPTPAAHFSLEESRLYLPETSVAVSNESSGANHFTWQYSGGIPIEEFEPAIELPAGLEGTYTLELTATNAFGCSNSFTKKVEVIQAIELFIPNSFTPNGDLINDSWEIDGLGIDSMHVQIEIYDVWGTLVFSADNPHTAWQGLAANGVEKLASGNYNYRILARDTERGIGHLFEGHITLLY